MPASSPSPTCQGVSNFRKKFLIGVVVLVGSVFIACLLASWERLPKSLPASASEPKCELKKEEKKKEEPCVPVEEPKKAEPKFDESKWGSYDLHDSVNYIYLKPGVWSDIIRCPTFRQWWCEVAEDKNPKPIKSITYFFPGDDFRFIWHPGEKINLRTVRNANSFMLFSPEGGWVMIRLKNY